MDIKIEINNLTLDNDHDTDTYDKLKRGYVTLTLGGERLTIEVGELKRALNSFE